VRNLRQILAGEICSIPKDKNGNSGWWFCVSGDTNIITKNGIVKIGDSVGKVIEVWNGENWSFVTPVVTGENRELYRVTISDGSFLDCTANHKWLVKTNLIKDFVEVETKDLMNFSKESIILPRPNISSCIGTHEEFAREYGFLLGDGWVREGHSPSARLYGKKINLSLRGLRGKNISKKNECNITFTDLDKDFSKKLKNNINLPKEVFSWDEKSIINFVSGWLDADGSKANNGCRLYGKENQIRDCQLLLTKIGINSSVNLMAKKGSITDFGARSESIWYLQIPNASKLSPERIDVSKGKEPRFKGKNQIVKSMEKLDGLHTTFCLNEGKLHQCVFNNVLTKQCNLSTINIKKIDNKEALINAARAASILGTIQASYTKFDYLGEVSENIAKEQALLGVSMTRHDGKSRAGI
jgi:hypothetical protein